MHTKKILNLTVDFKPNELFMADLNGLIISKLTDRFVGKCFQSMLITSINHIVLRSSVNLYRNMINGGGYVDVKTEVSGVILTEGEVMHGCEITSIEQTHITASNRYAIIRMQNDDRKITSILKVGMTIPIIVNKFGG